MLTMLPKIALIVCLTLFVVICVRAFFFTKKNEIERLSGLPLEDESDNLSGN